MAKKKAKKKRVKRDDIPREMIDWDFDENVRYDDIKIDGQRLSDILSQSKWK